MKKIFKTIIAIIFILSIENAYAKNWLIEDVLNLNYWPTIYELTLDNINTYSFKNSKLKNSYEKMVQYDNLVRENIVSEYEKWTYSTQTINWIIKNYKSFVFYTNQMFYFMNLVDKNKNLWKEEDIQNGILKNYKNASRFYKSTKTLINQKEVN